MTLTRENKYGKRVRQFTKLQLVRQDTMHMSSAWEDQQWDSFPTLRISTTLGHLSMLMVNVDEHELRVVSKGVDRETKDVHDLFSIVIKNDRHKDEAVELLQWQIREISNWNKLYFSDL